jgi:polysaccharide biosynthesis transport protein
LERSNLLQLARRSWLLLVAGAVIGGMAAHIAATQMKPTYQASTSLLAGPINADFDTQKAAGNVARTYADLATSGPILRKTIRTIHAKESVKTLRSNITSNSNDVTRIITIQAKASSAEESARLANEVAHQLQLLGSATGNSVVDSAMNDPSIANLTPQQQSAIRSLLNSKFGAASAGSLRNVDQAEVPTSAVAPRDSLITGMGIIGGLLIAGLLVFLRASTTTKIDAEDELPTADGVRVLGTVSAERRGRPGLVMSAGSSSEAADAYRLLAAKVGFAQNGRPIRSLLVVDGGDGEASGVTAANLASALAEMDARVTLVDANSTTGEITRLLGLDGQPGYADLLEETNGSIDLGELPLQEAADVHVLPRGHGDGRNVIELERARRLLDRLSIGADMVVINAPSADRSSSALIWARAADATLFVVERRKTKRATLEHALSSLALANANVIGTVFRS